MEFDRANAVDPAQSSVSKERWAAVGRARGLLAVGLLVFSGSAMAHGLSESSKQVVAEGGFADFVGLGAEHMIGGFDHLLFLFGVVFFLRGFRDILTFITAFTVGHCITLLGATMAGVSANAFLVDAFIALTVVYKGLENLGVLRSYWGERVPNLVFMVFFFGLVHGFGLSTRLQELALDEETLVSSILAFNLGVELGQVAALAVMLGFLATWRKTAAFAAFGRRANQALIAAGLALFVYQIRGYLHEGHPHEGSESSPNPHADHGDAHGHGAASSGEHSELPTAVAEEEVSQEKDRSPTQEPAPAPDLKESESEAGSGPNDAVQTEGKTHSHGGHSHTH